MGSAGARKPFIRQALSDSGPDIVARGWRRFGSSVRSGGSERRLCRGSRDHIGSKGTRPLGGTDKAGIPAGAVVRERRRLARGAWIWRDPEHDGRKYVLGNGVDRSGRGPVIGPRPAPMAKRCRAHDLIAFTNRT